MQNDFYLLKNPRISKALLKGTADAGIGIEESAVKIPEPVTVLHLMTQG